MPKDCSLVTHRSFLLVSGAQTICIWQLFLTNYYLLATFLKNWPLQEGSRDHLCHQVKFSGWNTAVLRTVPTKYKSFCARLGPCGKSRSLQGLGDRHDYLGIYPWSRKSTIQPGTLDNPEALPVYTIPRVIWTIGHRTWNALGGPPMNGTFPVIWTIV